MTERLPLSFRASAQTDTYYLLDAFGTVCPALKANIQHGIDGLQDKDTAAHCAQTCCVHRSAYFPLYDDSHRAASLNCAVTQKGGGFPLKPRGPSPDSSCVLRRYRPEVLPHTEIKDHAMALTQVVYVSKARKPFFLDELRELVHQASTNNAQLDVTGMLLYSSGCFMQVLEGEPANVQALFEKISKDSRHFDVQDILRMESEQRSFAYWGMRLLSLEHPTHLNVARLREVAVGIGDNTKARTAAPAMLNCMRDFYQQMPATISQVAGRDVISNLPT